MTVLWTPYMPQSGITWRQSRIEPSRVAPRRLTGLRTTVARTSGFRLPPGCPLPDRPPHRGHDRPWRCGSWDGRRRTRTARQGARSPVPPCRSARARRPAIIRTAFRAIVCRRVPGPAARPVRRPTARDLIVRIRGPGGAAFQHVSSRYTHTRGPERPSSSVRRTRFSLTDLRKSEPDITSAKWHAVAVGGGGAGVSVTGRRRRCGFRHPRPALSPGCRAVELSRLRRAAVEVLSRPCLSSLPSSCRVAVEPVEASRG